MCIVAFWSEELIAWFLVVFSDIHIVVVLPTSPLLYCPLSPSQGEPPFAISPSYHLYPAISLYLLYTFFCIYLPPPRESPPFPISLIRSHVPCYLPLHCSLNPISWQWSHFTFLLFVDTSGYVLTFEDMELGASHKREHLSFWAWVTSLNKIFSSFNYGPGK